MTPKESDAIAHALYMSSVVKNDEFDDLVEALAQLVAPEKPSEISYFMATAGVNRRQA